MLMGHTKKFTGRTTVSVVVLVLASCVYDSSDDGTPSTYCHQAPRRAHTSHLALCSAGPLTPA